MNTSDKGSIAEALVLSELLKRGFRVAIPYGDYRYDLIAEAKGRFARIQIKYVGAPTKRSTVNVVLHSITRKGRAKYAKEEIDCIVVFYEPEKSFFIIPYDDVAGKTALNIRLKNSKNNQQAGVVPSARYKERWDLI